MDEREHLDMLARGASLPDLFDDVVATRDADTQSAYETAAWRTFDSLDELDRTLATRRFLSGQTSPSAQDWALYVVLLRFELVYYDLYKLNRTRIRDFDHLSGYLRDMHQRAPEVDVRAIRREAFIADRRRNPKGTVPVGLVDLWAPHGRSRFDIDETREVGTEDSGSRRRGEFVRGRSAHRRIIGRDLPAESGRYHLIVANNCPWCHRTALTRALKDLENVVSMDVLYYRRDPDRGWQFRGELDGFDHDSLYGATYVQELYERVGSTETSVPILWDKHEETVVNNESAEIIRMFDEAWPDRGVRLVPPELAREVDEINAWVYTDVNNGAYKAGFSSDQTAYERAFKRFFAALDRLDERLAGQRWLCGDVVTEADVRLFPTIFRFDPVYYVRMRLNHKMVREYPNLSRWQRDFWTLDGVAGASNIEHCRLGYFGRTGDNLIPIGPVPGKNGPVLKTEN